MSTPFCTKSKLFSNISDVNLLKNKNIHKALKIAYKVHKNQKRDNGGPYLEQHIYPIAQNICLRYSTDPKRKKLIIIALLHDCLEDNSGHEVNKSIETFDSSILKCLKDLTLKRSNDGMNQIEKYNLYSDYISQVKSGGREAIIVKLEDRLNNLQSTTEELVPRKLAKYTRQVKETRNLLIPLTQGLDTTVNYATLLNKEISRLNQIFNSLN
jgi:(p)ppGpp synthase/HD superfamily hydrolase